MKKSYILGLAVFVFAALGYAGSASATICLSGGANLQPKYETKVKCEAMTPELATGEWVLVYTSLISSIAITDAEGWVAMLTSPEVLAEDMGLGVDLLCLEAVGSGTLEEEGLATISTGSCTTVNVGSGTCGSPKLGPADLPWHTFAYADGTTKLDAILADGKGAPGWEAECTVLGVKAKDLCTTESGKPTVKEVGGNLEIEFLANTQTGAEQAECSIGGKEEGLVNGTFKLEALNSTGTEKLAIELM